MGLSGQKKRTKLSHDPNNTTWAKNTDGFGHRILAAQGWKPGDYLGAENASHADHYTAANASHIRVMLREDNLGLGAQIGKGNAETFGLSMFSGLLGRLNGKSDEELESQQIARRDAEIRIQHEKRYGLMNFISGGFLVGDKMEAKTESKPAVLPASQPVKRKRSDEHESEEQSKEKKIKRATAGESAQPREAATDSSSSDDSGSELRDDEDLAANGSKLVAKKKPREKRSKSEQGGDLTEAKAQKARDKAERRARKEERRKRRQEKQERRALRESKREGKKTQEADEQSAEQSAAPLAAVASNAVLSNGSRHATRQRYIQQKRMASMDPKALKEIFMLQAAS